MWNALKESDLFSVASVASRPALPFSFFPCLGLLFRVSFRFNFVSERQKKKSNKSGGLFPSSAGATRPRPRRHVSVGRSFHDFAQIHRSMAGSSVDWVFIGFYRVLPCFYCFFLYELGRVWSYWMRLQNKNWLEWMVLLVSHCKASQTNKWTCSVHGRRD